MDNLASLDLRDAAVLALTAFWTVSVFVSRKPRRAHSELPSDAVFSR